MEPKSSDHNAPPPIPQPLPPPLLPLLPPLLQPLMPPMMPPPHYSAGGYLHPDQARPSEFSTQPNIAHEAFLIEMEKKKIREEIIAAEVRRRHLEAEVRREMLMEREMALPGTHGFPLFHGPQNMPKPEENVTGNKRKATSPPPTLHLVDREKKLKEKVYCELCHVRVTSEVAMQEHFEGKKHKSKEAKQTFSIGLFSKKSNNSPKKLEEITQDISKEEPKEDKLAHDDVATSEKVEKYKSEYPFWCEMCKIGVYSEKVLEAHERGRKHKNRLLDSLTFRLAAASNNKNILEIVEEKEITTVKSVVADMAKVCEEK